ncbi:MAG TPA: cyclopropane fatty acyl phospholipid synthase [Kofleriaceae bacterium]
MGSAKRIVVDLLGRAGVGTEGREPWDLEVLDDRLYGRILAQGSLGFGDSYVEGWWQCPRIDELIHRLLSYDLEADVGTDWRVRFQLLKAKLVNLQAPSRAPEVAAHYELGNEFFERVLGKTVMYSCAYWRRAGDLDAAQTDKIDLVARKLEVCAGEHVLDLGCGWGAIAEHLARSRGCRVTAVTISPAQAAYVRRRCAGLPVDVLEADYRDPRVAAAGPYDKIACVGMMEHVGRKNYRGFLGLCARLVKPGGLCLVHTIGTSVTTDVTDPWIERRIFPGSVLPSVVDVARAAEGQLTLEDWHSLGADYDRTLLAWHDNFDAYVASGELARGEPFNRTWRYYLLSFAGCFRTRRTIQLWQMVFSAGGRKGGHVSVR